MRAWKSTSTGNATSEVSHAASPGKQSLIDSLSEPVQRKASAGGEPRSAALSAPVQRKALSDAGPGHTIQALFGHHQPVQLHEAGSRETSDAETRVVAMQGVAGGGGALPHGDAIAASFGRHAPKVEGIRAHVGGAAAEASSSIGAQAYTTGNSIAFASQPDLGLAAHEAAHVVQQAGGVQLKSGIGQAGDVYEQHADAVAAEVVAGRSAERLLDEMAGGGASSAPQHQVQRKDVPTHFGTFKTSKFEKYTTTGVNAVVEFHPDPAKIDAKKIGMSQSVVITYPDGTHTGIDPTKEGRRVKSGAGKDYVLDRISSKNNPIYGAGDLGANEGIDKTAADNNPSADPTKVATPADGGNATYQLGHAFKDAGVQKTKEAALYDRPAGGGGNLFETTALGLEGTDKDKYFGSVKWGYVVNGTDVDIKDIELASMGVPTQHYLAAAELWNNTKTRGTLEVTASPAKAKKVSDMSAVDVAQGTKVRHIDVAFIAGTIMTQVAAVTGGDQYYINVTDLKDTQDGSDTANVPVPQVFINPAVTPLFSDAEMKTKLKDLPANTRMENTLCTIHGSYGMRIVDGPDIRGGRIPTTDGYVDQTKIQRER